MFPIVRQAVNIPDIKIVSYEWLLKSIEGQKKEDENKYQLAQSGDSDTPKIDIADENKARSPTPTESEIQAEEKPPESILKNKKAAKGKKRARSPTLVEEEEGVKAEDKAEDKAPEKKRIKKTGKGKKRAQSPALAKAESLVKGEQEEVTQESPDKKQKDGQKVKNPALRVPVDEQFAARSNGKSS